jgi:hypothetical protein
MRPVKVRPRWRCDFCTRTSSSVKAMAEHEQRCWRNPNRRCQLCEGKGFWWHESYKVTCHYCEQYDPQIAERAVMTS